MPTSCAVALTAVCALLAWATTAIVVPRLPEPPDDGATPGWHKPPYRSLGTPAVQAGAAALGAAAGAVATTLPTPALPLACMLAGPVTSLCLVDALTTYLPLPLTRACQALATAAVLPLALLAGDPLATALRLGIAAVVTWAVFWLVWRTTRALGYGDVRLAPLLALGPASVGWGAWQHFLVLGSLAGALWGVVTRLVRRRRPSALGSVFPYGPGLWLGCWAALLL